MKNLSCAGSATAIGVPAGKTTPKRSRYRAILYQFRGPVLG